MSETSIICKATMDTFVRFGIVIAALLGFAGYFFYDGAVGYRNENAQIFSYKAFADLGQGAAATLTPVQWQAQVARQPLIKAGEQEGEWVVADAQGHVFPLPEDCEATRSCPAEAQDQAAMRTGWSECWAAYSQRMHYPIKPAEHAHDEGAIREQWIAGGLFTVLGLVLLYFALRTRGRELALRGDKVTAAGQTFAIADIQSIDLRQWGPGFKGVAYFTVGGKKIRVDGMTYGGFSKDKGQPAEEFMKAVLARYKGEVVEYEAAGK